VNWRLNELAHFACDRMIRKLERIASHSLQLPAFTLKFPFSFQPRIRPAMPSQLFSFESGRMEMDWPRRLAYVVDQEPLLRNEYLTLKNRILKTQIQVCCSLLIRSGPPWVRPMMRDIAPIRNGGNRLSSLLWNALPDIESLCEHHRVSIQCDQSAGSRGMKWRHTETDWF
jgi:hypothetical protein